MNWISLSFLTAFLVSISTALTKKSLKNFSEYTLSFSVNFFPLFFLVAFIILFRNTDLSFWEKIFGEGIASVFSVPNIASLSFTFWKALFIDGTLSIIAVFLLMKALKNHEMSLIMPLLSLTPIFTLFISPILIGKTEIPNIFGATGVFLVFIGLYILNIKERKEGLLMPFKILIKNKGSMAILLVAFIYSITSIYDKVGSISSSSLFFTFSLDIFIALAFLPVIIFRYNKRKKSAETNSSDMKKIFVILVLLGLINAVSNIAQLTAIQLSLVAYVIAIKRSAILLTVIFGFLFFREKNLRDRFWGSFLMILGVFLMTMFK